MTPNQLQMLALCEGGCVMLWELGLGQQVSVWFGNSTVVWASVLGVTMLGLACGYFAGGWLSIKTKTTWIPAMLLMLASVLAGCSFLLFQNPPATLLNASPETGSLAMMLLLGFPAFTLAGMAIPLGTGQIPTQKENAGEVSGNAFFASAAGGFVFGSLIFHMAGYNYLSALIIVNISLFLYLVVFQINVQPVTVSLLFIAVCTGMPLMLYYFQRSLPDNVIFQAHGPRGQTIVTEDISGTDTVVSLYYNGMSQTVKNLNSECKPAPYVKQIVELGGLYNPTSQALVLGVGGGTLAKQLAEIGFEVTTIDNEGNSFNIVYNFFQNGNYLLKLIHDDGRHFINSDYHKYELIVMDVFTGDAPPRQMFTLEAFERARNLLEPGGMLVVMFPADEGKEINPIAGGVIKTLQEANFLVTLMKKQGPGNGAHIFVCTTGPLDRINGGKIRKHPCYENELISLDPAPLPPLKEYSVYTDDKPIYQPLVKIPPGFRKVF